MNNLEMYINLDYLSKNEIRLIKKINKDINDGEKEITNIIQNTLNYITGFKIEEERCNNKEIVKNIKSIDKIIASKKGNIFEITKVFMSIIRYCKIPTKLIFGIINKSLYHSWVEIYSESIGWIPVEIKVTFKIKDEKYYFGITNKHIKLFEDINFENISKKIEKIDIEVLDINEPYN